MGRIFQPLLFVLVRCTRNQLIRQIEFLKAENEMLRKRIPRRAIVLNPEERDRLIRLGQASQATVKATTSALDATAVLTEPLREICVIFLVSQ
jgi:putative transposase